MRYFIQNASIIDPAQRIISLGHILVEDGVISRIFDLAEPTPYTETDTSDMEIINAHGCVVTPGFIELHTNLGEPGLEHLETIATGTLAAARGGFTTVCTRPITTPVPDTLATIRYIRQRVQEAAFVTVENIAAMTTGCRGETLTEMAALIDAGCVALSDDEQLQAPPALMHHALAYASMLHVPIISHCGSALSHGIIHEGAISTRLGLPGSPVEDEEQQIAMHIALAEMTGAHLHISHVSTAGGVQLLRQAKARNVAVTADVTPYHLTMTDQWVLGSLHLRGLPSVQQEELDGNGTRYRKTRKLDTHELQLPLYDHTIESNELRSPLWFDPALLAPFDPATRIRPPLRSQEDSEALIQGLSDGTIDALSSAHTPLPSKRTAHIYGEAACGISGLETTLGIAISLVSVGALDLMNVVSSLTEGPARVLGRTPPTLTPGNRADIVVFDPEYVWKVDATTFASKGKNTPFHGQNLKGRVMLTMSGGNIVFQYDNFGTGKKPKPRASVLTGILNNDSLNNDSDLLKI